MNESTSPTMAVHGTDASPHACANCGATLHGAFCHACGQPAHVHRSLLHLVEELLHGILHFETRAWRTLVELVWRPGEMIREYTHGRRARYVAPLPLFLFMMFALFLAFSLTSTSLISDTPREQDTAATPQPAASAPQTAPRKDAHWLPALTRGIRPVSAEELHRELMENVPWAAHPALERKILHAANNRELTLYKFKNAAPKYAILLVPLTLPLLWLIFIRRRDVQLFDHVVFALYSLCAMAMLLILASLLDAFGLTILGLGLGLGELLKLLPPVMFFMQLRGAYQLTRWGALWRSAILVVHALLAISVYLLIVIAIAM
jgi:hypothetical protein